MTEVTFEQAVEVWSRFCSSQGSTVLPVDRLSAESFIKSWYQSVTNGESISAGELELIYDTTCDKCEAYILHLMQTYNWDLKRCEDVLLGRDGTTEHIQFCTEVVLSCIANMKIASTLNTIGRPKSVSSVPNMARFTNSSSSSLPASLSVSSLPAYVPTGVSSSTSSPAVSKTHFDAVLVPSTSTNPASISDSSSLQHRLSQPSHTSSAPALHTSTLPANNISTHGMPPPLPPKSFTNPQSGKAPPLPPRVSSMPPSTVNHIGTHPKIPFTSSHSAPQSTTYQVSSNASNATLVPSTQASSRTIASTASMPISSATTANQAILQDGNTVQAQHHHHHKSNSSSSHISHQSKGTQSTSIDSDWKVRPPCTYLAQQGYCTPRTCQDLHLPHQTICKWLMRNGLCDAHNCPYQHPNVAARDSLLAKLHSSSFPVLSDWNDLRLNGVFYSPITPKPKLCRKGHDCKNAHCRKQHRKDSSNAPEYLAPLRRARTLSSTLKLTSTPSKQLVPSTSAGSTKTAKTSTPSSTTPSTTPHAGSSAISPPAKEKRSIFRLKDVTSELSHVSLVQSIMQGGYGAKAKHLTITRLVEIINNDLDEQYKAYFAITQNDNQGMRPNEIYGFHGAPATAIASIAKTGFDMNKVKRTLYGHGLYCALDPSVSVGYADSSKQLLLVRLITNGLHWVPDQGYYVIHESASMNPLYIITFK